MYKLAQFDAGPLSWVKEEIDQTLARVSAAVRTQTGNQGDQTALRLARTNLHQVQGVLRLINLDGAAQFTSELELLLGDLVGGATDPVLSTLAERGFNALSTFLEQLLDGQPNYPLRLFALYREVCRARRKPDPDPIDLYYPGLMLSFADGERVATNRVDPGHRLRVLERERGRYQRGVLLWLKEHDAQGAADMRKALTAISRVEETPSVHGFWRAAAALAEAVGEGLVTDDSTLGPIWLRLERQITRAQTEAPTVPERLAREVLFHVARTYPATAALREMQHVFRLAGSVPEKYDLAVEEAVYLPRLRALREVVLNAKGAWMRYASGYSPVVQPFCEFAVTLRDRSANLGRWELSRVAEEMLAVADKFREVPGPIDDAVALEVATALLLLEDAVAMSAPLPAEYAQQFQAVIDRLRQWRERNEAVLRSPSPLLAEVVRRAQDRMAIAQIVAEIQINLRSVEKSLDAFFRDHLRRGLLTGIDTLLAQVAGAFRILGEQRAAETVDECTERARAFATPNYVPQPEDFEYVAGLLAAIGAHTEALQHGAADIDVALRQMNRGTSFNTDAASAEAPSVEREMAEMQRATPAQLEAWREAPADTERKDELRNTLEAIKHDAEIASDSTLGQRANEALSLLEQAGAPVPELQAVMDSIASSAEPVPAPSAQTEQLAESPREVIDAELLAIYLEEATEVLAVIQEAVNRVRAKPAIASLGALRRAFHTLKGSGRMVGLTDPAETAYALERTLERFIENGQPANDRLLQLLDQAHTHFQAVIEALRTERPVDSGTAIVELAEAVREAKPGSSASGTRLPDRLFAIFVSEANELITILRNDVMQMPFTGTASEDAQRAAHTLSGIAATAYMTHLHDLAGALEQAMLGAPTPLLPPVRTLFGTAVVTLEKMLRDIEAGRAPAMSNALIVRLESLFPHADELDGRAPPGLSAADDDDDVGDLLDLVPADWGTESSGASLREPPSLGYLPSASADAPSGPRDEPEFAQLAEPSAGLTDVIDPALVSYLIEETQELFPVLGAGLRTLEADPGNGEPIAGLQRALHTLKGSARTTGAFRLGSVLHEMETLLENAAGETARVSSALPQLLAYFDDADRLLDQLRPGSEASAVPFTPTLPAPSPLSDSGLTRSDAAGPVELDAALAAVPSADALGQPQVEGSPANGAASAISEPLPVAPALPGDMPVATQLAGGGTVHIEPSASASPEGGDTTAEPEDAQPLAPEAERIAVLRVRAETIDRLVDSVGEVTIARGRIESEVRALKTALADLTENVARLRQQMREVEIQAEVQMQSRMVSTDERSFDPLEFDRFTRFQELTRLMAESVNDVGTVQSSIGRAVDEAESALAAQQRLSRDLQQDLLRVRMLPFSTVAERMYRVVRQASRETGKPANLEIRNGQVELDRSVLERLTAPIEHVLRNAVVHGIEDEPERTLQGKPATGQIVIELRGEGNQIAVVITDDGRGLAAERVRTRAIEMGLIAADQQLDAVQIAELVFQPGFSTAGTVTALAGRGIGMEIVRADIASIGGRVELSFEPGQGARVLMELPLTLMVTQTVLVDAGQASYVIPSSLVEQVRQIRGEELAACVRDGVATSMSGRPVPFYYLPNRLGDEDTRPTNPSLASVVFVRVGGTGAAVRVDTVHGNLEIVVKNTGPLLSHIAGISGATVLASGEIILIINPITLAQRAMPLPLPLPPTQAPEVKSSEAIEILIVDDSLTVRRATERLLNREGFVAHSARDGIEALEMLRKKVPAAMLVDIEMPRMDGFDLLRNLRADPLWAGIPVMMISSRTAEKHRRLARDLGVNAFFGKPYREDDLISELRRMIEQRKAPASQSIA